MRCLPFYSLVPVYCHTQPGHTSPASEFSKVGCIGSFRLLADYPLQQSPAHYTRRNPERRKLAWVRSELAVQGKPLRRNPLFG